MNALSLNMIQLLIPLVWPALIGGIFLQAIPDFMRPGLFFGVTVDPRFRESQLARGIRRRYTTAIWGGTLLAIAFATTAAFATTHAVWAATALAVLASHAELRPVLLIPQFAVALWAFARANRATRPHALGPVGLVQVELSTRWDAIGPLKVIIALPLVSLIGLGLWAAICWSHVPAQMAVHWSFSGPDRWVPTTPGAVMTLLARKGIVCLLLALLAWGVLYGSRRIATAGTAARRERQFRMRILALLIAAGYFAAFPLWGALLGFPATIMTLWYLIWPATILVLLARLVLVGQGGSRGLPSADGAPVGDRMQNRYWAWGLIYINRGDPAFLVEKRFGIGYTFNFGHPLAWLVITLIVAVPLIGRFT
jgi:uncharacterized membrane protein